MQVLIYFFISSLFLFHYLVEMGLAPRALSLTPELFSIVFLVVFALRGALQKEIKLDAFYLVVLILLLFEIALGVLLNALPGSVLIAGIRDNFKFIPLLLLPSVYPFSEQQLKHFLLFLLGLTLLQLPVTLYQRFVQYAGTLSGDPISGTLKGSGILSVYLMAAATMLTAFYLKGLLKKSWYFACLIMVFIPTTVNETKVTLFLLPVAILVPVLFNESDPHRFRKVLGAAMVIGLLATVFVPVYDHFMSARRTEGLMEFFTTEGRLEEYLTNTGRLSSPNEIWRKNPTGSLLGLGIGNVSDSILGPSFTGKYFYQFESDSMTALAHWRFEIGLLGTALILILFSKVFVDANRLAHGSGILSAFALGWLGVLAVLGISLVYNKTVRSNEVGFLLWFFSGYLAATRWWSALPCTAKPGTTSSDPGNTGFSERNLQKCTVQQQP